jgi:hypothetical protein
MKHQDPDFLAAESVAAPVLDLPVDIDSRLNRTEWAVIENARDDGPRSVNPNGITARLLRLLFGVSVPRALANERLEALRRFAVKGWYWSELKTRDIRALFEAGFDSNDAWRVLAHIAARRGVMAEIEHWPA